MKTIYIILGSIREVRNGEKVANFIKEYAIEYKNYNFELIDLKDWPLPLFAESGSPKYGNYKNELQIKWSEKVKKADGFIFVSPEYNHGYTAVLKNALDYLYDEWANKPAAFVGYGALAGGSRAIQQLKQVVLELKMNPIHDEVLISNVWDAFNANGQPKNEVIISSTKLMFEELITALG